MGFNPGISIGAELSNNELRQLYKCTDYIKQPNTYPKNLFIRDKGNNDGSKRSSSSD